MHVLWQIPRNKTLNSWQQLTGKYPQVGPSMRHNGVHAHCTWPFSLTNELPQGKFIALTTCASYHHSSCTYMVLQSYIFDYCWPYYRNRPRKLHLEPVNFFVWCELNCTWECIALQGQRPFNNGIISQKVKKNKPAQTCSTVANHLWVITKVSR